MNKKRYQEIDFDGKKLPVYYGLNDISSVEKDPEEIKKNATGYFIDVIWRGIQSGYKKAGEKIDMSKSEFEDLLNDSPQGFSETIKYFRERQQAFFGGFEEKKE